MDVHRAIGVSSAACSLEGEAEDLAMAPGDERSVRSTRQCKSWLARLCAVVVLGGGAAAQVTVLGDWAGPYELAVDVYAGVQYPTGEIAHAALLPPAPVAGSPPTSHTVPRILLIPRINWCPPVGFDPPIWPDPPQQVFGRTYRWSPDRPSLVTQIDVPPGFPQDATQDIFCGGHTFLADGRLLLTNGTDVATTCLGIGTPGSWGHSGAWVLDTLVQDGALIKAYGPGDEPQDRWYPTATLSFDGKVFVHGHTLNPVLTPTIAQRRDEFSWNAATLTGTWIADLHNKAWTPDCVPPATPVSLLSYPRLHLSRSGYLVWSTAFFHGVSTPETQRSLFLRIDPPDCELPDPTEPYRWRVGATTAAEAAALHINGSSVHYITWDPAGGPPEGTFTEVIYAIGGADEPVEGGPNDCVAAMPTASVERLTIPELDPHLTASWSAAPSMNRARVNHNAVIALDGSIVVVGGVDCSGGGFVDVKHAEMFMPPEVYGGIPPSPDWVELAEGPTARRYHSSAVLLPDGRIVNPGGVNIVDVDTVPDHSLDVFSPPYCFRGGPPAIVPGILIDPAAGAYEYDLPIEFDVTLAPGRSVDRVAVIRNGSATHAFNPDQRYVELRIIETIDAALPNTKTIRAAAPRDGKYAPPGFYLLTVVDDQGVPATAEWIRLADVP
jgi:hypothetical protein